MADTILCVPATTAWQPGQHHYLKWKLSSKMSSRDSRLSLVFMLKILGQDFLL